MKRINHIFLCVAIFIFTAQFVYAQTLSDTDVVTVHLTNGEVKTYADMTVESIAHTTTTMTVTSINGQTDTYDIIKVNKVEFPLTPHDKSIGFGVNYYDINLCVGDTRQIIPSVTINDVKIENPQIIWASSDETIAIVSETGLVTAIAEGTATVKTSFTAFNMIVEINTIITVLTDSICQQLQREREALAAIYRALDGENWRYKESWSTGKPIGEWDPYHIRVNSDGFVEELNLFYYSEDFSYKTTTDDLFKLRHLKSLFVDSWSLVLSITDSIKNLQKLETIELHNAKVSERVSPEVFKLKSLKTLMLLSGRLTGDDINNFHVSFPRLETTSNIKRLYLSSCKIDSIQNIGTLNNLEELILVPTNNIPIPSEIGNLKKLKVFSADDGSFTGFIPPEIVKCDSLKILELHGNNLTGSLPADLPENILSINVSKNNLSGIISENIKKTKAWKYHWGDIVWGNHFSFSYNDLDAPDFKFEDLNGDSIISDSLYYQKEYVIFYTDLPGYSLDQYLEELYNKYKNCGLEIIEIGSPEKNSPWPTVMTDNDGSHKNFFYYESDMYCITSYPARMIGPTVAVVDCHTKKIVYSNLIEDMNTLLKLLAKKFEGAGSDLYVSSDNSSDGNVRTIQTATIGNGIDIVLMGDGYSDRQIAAGDYDKVINDVAEKLFTEEPYKSFKDYFNVYAVTAVSKNEGYSEYSETALGGYFGAGSLAGGNDSQAFAYAMKAIGEERMDNANIIVMMNKDAYAGTCYMYNPTNASDYGNGTSISYFPVSSDDATFTGLVYHEAMGHGFAKLDDEYAYEDYGAAPSDVVTSRQQNQNDWGWWRNVDFTDDPTAVRWSKFLNDERYANDGLGVFEGGATYWTGVWRPTKNSIMRYNTGGFNAPSREAIYYRIHKLAFGNDWQYNYEDFVAYDAINRTAAAKAHRKAQTKSVDVKNFQPTPPPIIIPHSWREAKTSNSRVSIGRTK